MRKHLFIIASVLLLVSSTAYSQYALDKGQAQLNAGIGFSGWGVPLYVGVDYGVHKYISIGGEVSYRSYYDGYGLDRQSIVGITGNGNFHFGALLQIPKVWDIYAGLNAGFFYASNTNGVSALASNGGIGGQFGARYYFKDNFAANLELGGSTIFDSGKIGISYIFK